MAKTYHEILLAHLRSGRTITVMEAFSLYDITCAGQRLGELRRGEIPGIPAQNIVDNWEKSTGPNGKVFKYKRFRLVTNEKDNAQKTD